MMKRLLITLTTCTALLFGTAQAESICGDMTPMECFYRYDLKTAASGGHLVVALERRDGRNQVLVLDLQRDEMYQLAELSGRPVQSVTWLTEERLELVLKNGNARIVLDYTEGESGPEFRLVTSRKQGELATPVDYYSEPLLALHQPQPREELHRRMIEAASQVALEENNRS